MVLLLLLVVAVSAFYAFAVWPRNGHGPGTRRARRSGDAEPAADAARPESLEGVLVAQLVAGEITRRQYRRAMGQLAARDDERSPMAVPPEGGGAEFWHHLITALAARDEARAVAVNAAVWGRLHHSVDLE